MVLWVQAARLLSIGNSRDSVNIQTDHKDAKIYVDGKFVGEGSGMVSLTKRGDHTIRVVKDGCREGMAQTTRPVDPVSFLGMRALDCFDAGGWWHCWS